MSRRHDGASKGLFPIVKMLLELHAHARSAISTRQVRRDSPQVSRMGLETQSEIIDGTKQVRSKLESHKPT